MRPHEIPTRSPLLVRPGEVVEVGERDPTWPAFVYISTENGEGWVPARYLTIIGDEVVVETGYDTKELPTAAGEELEIVVRDDASGWHWCRNHAGDQGWVPADTIEELA